MEIITQNEKILYIGIDVIRTAHWAGSGKKAIDFCCFLKSTEIVMFKTGMTTSNFWRVVKPNNPRKFRCRIKEYKGI